MTSGSYCFNPLRLNGFGERGSAAVPRRGSYQARLREFVRFAIAPHQRVLVVRAGDDGGDDGDQSPSGQTDHQGSTLDVTDLDLSAEELKPPYDYIVLGDALDRCQDIGPFLHQVWQLCEPHTRVILSSRRGVLPALSRPAGASSIDGKGQPRNSLSEAQLKAIMASSGFQRIGSRRLLEGLWRQRFAVYRPVPSTDRVGDDSLTICLTCRNEKGNIEPIVRAIPTVTDQQEILFVEGHSDDGTRAEIERVKEAYPEKNIRLISQPGKGQGDAIREGFSQATGAFIILLEADMTSPPADIVPVYQSLRAGFSEFVEGTRFVYPMTRESMPLTNRVGNLFFARYFSWLLRQHASDVLCGIKGISSANFKKIAARWGQWRVEDPFGDFELLLGAAQIGLKFGEIPVHYQPRPYGKTKTSAFRHGAVLFRLAASAFVAFHS